MGAQERQASCGEAQSCSEASQSRCEAPISCCEASRSCCETPQSGGWGGVGVGGGGDTTTHHLKINAFRRQACLKISVFLRRACLKIGGFLRLACQEISAFLRQASLKISVFLRQATQSNLDSLSIPSQSLSIASTTWKLLEDTESRTLGYVKNSRNLPTSRSGLIQLPAFES